MRLIFTIIIKQRENFTFPLRGRHLGLRRRCGRKGQLGQHRDEQIDRKKRQGCGQRMKESCYQLRVRRTTKLSTK